MVVDDFEIVGISFFPTKAESPLVVDPNTVLTFPITCSPVYTVERLMSNGTPDLGCFAPAVATYEVDRSPTHQGAGQNSQDGDQQFVAPAGDYEELAVIEAAQAFRDHEVGRAPKRFRNSGAVGVDDIVKFGERVAGAQGLNGDGRLPRPELNGKALGKAIHPGFGGAVADILRSRGEGGHGRYIDDAGACEGTRLQVRERRVGEARRRDHVEQMHLNLAGGIGFKEVTIGAEARVVD